MSNETVKTISGEVYYLERIALMSNSTLQVRLLDVSLQDVSSQVVFPKVLAVQKTPNAEKGGLKFSLTYSVADVLPGHTYAISATITHEHRLIFATLDPRLVDLGVDHVEEQEVRVRVS
ncbi:YbaY family lipoprotein [Pseudomonas laurylsulfatiphila]|uniref:YbaY family lipoprotein n=1 Tax=Pseudomonas laurylsulfatiphila TaxID=2011015 RepID=UPI003D24A08B